MHKIVKYSLLVFLFLILVFIRAFENDLFYDPLIHYFENDYLYASIPKIKNTRFIGNLFFRYFLNTIISLVIIGVVFQKKETIKFAVYFYSIAFVVLVSVLLFLLKDQFQSGYLLFFYIRRFIIHPIFLLLLLAVFYYQRKMNTTNN